jgi:5'-methylthioinosine phosphorylase
VSVIGIIAGTGAELFPRRAETLTQTGDRRWGEPSAAIECWQQQGHTLLFLPRHGPNGAIPPHRVNYRANLSLLQGSGAETIIALNAVGGIADWALPGVLAVPDQLVDYTWGRTQTYYDEPDVNLEFIDFTKPYSEVLRRKILSASTAAGIRVETGGTYGVTQGPRLETAAEIDRLERDGCDLVGMTSMPEAALARELGLHYACIALVVNRAAGRGDQAIHADIGKHIGATVQLAGGLIEACLQNL